MHLRRAVAYLKNVISEKECVPFRRYNGGVGRCAQVGGYIDSLWLDDQGGLHSDTLEDLGTRTTWYNFEIEMTSSKRYSVSIPTCNIRMKMYSKIRPIDSKTFKKTSILQYEEDIFGCEHCFCKLYIWKLALLYPLRVITVQIYVDSIVLDTLCWESCAAIIWPKCKYITLISIIPSYLIRYAMTCSSHSLNERQPLQCNISHWLSPDTEWVQTWKEDIRNTVKPLI